MTDLHDAFALADLFEREGDGPRDVLTGAIPGGPWGGPFCDRVAKALRSLLAAARTHAPVQAETPPTEAAGPPRPLQGDTLGELMVDAQRCGLQRVTITKKSDGRFQVSSTYDGVGWKCCTGENMAVELINALDRPALRK